MRTHTAARCRLRGARGSAIARASRSTNKLLQLCAWLNACDRVTCGPPKLLQKSPQKKRTAPAMRKQLNETYGLNRVPACQDADGCGEREP